MKDPPSVANLQSFFYPSPDRMGSSWYIRPGNILYGFWLDNDRGGVHLNSGVNNKLCFLLTDGDTFNNQTVSGMGIAKVIHLYYECQHLLTAAADYGTLYYALQQAAINLPSEFSCQDRANLDTACRAVELPLGECLRISTDNDAPLMRIDTAGNLYLRSGASVFTEQESITPNPNVAEVLVRDANGDVLVRVDSQTGDLYLTGKLYQDKNFIWQYPQDSLFVWNDDEAMAIVTSYSFYDALIDLFCSVPAGSLILDGRVYCDVDPPVEN